MRIRNFLPFWANTAIILCLSACSSSTASSDRPGSDGGVDAEQPEAGEDVLALDAAPDTAPDAAPDSPLQPEASVEANAPDSGVSCDEKAAHCATEEQFGELFTKTNGRADGTLVALVRPTDQQCTWPNGSHVTVQLSILGGVQRLVVSVEDIALTSVPHALIGPPYQEGWHENQNLDYWTDLGVHSTDLEPATKDQAVEFICSYLELGQEVSVFAYSDGSRPSSAHQVHRNDKYPDGAIVANPTSANPTYLLFRYEDQVF